jgi:hypothetical protein
VAVVALEAGCLQTRYPDPNADTARSLVFPARVPTQKAINQALDYVLALVA